MLVVNTMQSKNITSLQETPDIEVSYDKKSDLYVITGQVKNLIKTKHTGYRGKFDNIPFNYFRNSFNIGSESFSVGFNLKAGDILSVLVADGVTCLKPVGYYRHRNDDCIFLNNYSGRVFTTVILLCMVYLIYLILTLFPFIVWPLALIVPYQGSKAMIDQYVGLNKQSMYRRLLVKNNS